MRLFVDTLLALMLIGVLGGMIWYQRQQEDWLNQVTLVQQAMRAIQSQATYHAAIGETDTTEHGYAQHIDPAWFDHRPLNTLFADEARPWVDTLGEAERAQFNPKRIIATGTLAAFWYNPWRGLLRARVPMQLSQRATVDLYNLVNGTSIRNDDVDWSDPTPILYPDKTKLQRMHLDAPGIKPKSTSVADAKPALSGVTPMRGAIQNHINDD